MFFIFPKNTELLLIQVLAHCYKIYVVFKTQNMGDLGRCMPRMHPYTMEGISAPALKDWSYKTLIETHQQSRYVRKRATVYQKTPFIQGRCLHPYFREGELTSTLQRLGSPSVYCKRADLLRTLHGKPHSYTQIIHSSKYRSPLIHCNSLYEKGFK